MQITLIRYIKSIRKKAKEYAQRDINGNKTKNRWYYKTLFFCIIAGVVTFYLSKYGFDERIVEYATTVLSIFVGIFMTLLVFAVDEIPDKKSHQTEDSDNGKKRLKTIQKYNFYKPFVCILGYTVLLSVICIICIFLQLLINDMSFNPFDYSFTKQITKEAFFLFCKGLFISLLRFLCVYLIIDIFYYTLYAVSGYTHNILNTK